MPVHIYGRRCNMQRIAQIADVAGLKVIEDMSEIHGVRPQACSDAACWSFYKNKIIHGEEGGCVAFNSQFPANDARSLRSLGFTENHDFLHQPRGHNYRLSNSHASLILQSKRDWALNSSHRRLVEGWYDEAVPKEWRMPQRDAVWIYDIRIPGMTVELQKTIVTELKSIGVRYAFKPMSRQPEYYSLKWTELNANRLSREVIYFPVTEKMTIEDVNRNVGLLMEIVKKTQPSLLPSPVLGRSLSGAG